MNKIGISGIAVYLPRYRVDLKDWCEWTGANWSKISSIVGNSFRLPGVNENMYTMAANAVLSLIKQHNIDPSEVGFLGLGTETSTDNAAGAVIVKGIVNQGLKELGLPLFDRSCEVPEFKQACLGGVYAMKGAMRYLAFDGSGKKAIVVCSDIAKYEQKTAGEPTQGAGAVALLIEENPKLLNVDLKHSGVASDYRVLDFRKPISRFAQQNMTEYGQLNDFPILNGQYSTTCYIDEVLFAFKDFVKKRSGSVVEFFQNLSCSFLHRPYAQMAETGWLICYLYMLSIGGEDEVDQLQKYCDKASVSYDDVCNELTVEHDFLSLVEQKRLTNMVYSKTLRVVRMISRDPEMYRAVCAPLLETGWDFMKDVGNVYTASLFIWIAAGLKQACKKSASVYEEFLAIGYGSGDAAEVIPMSFVEDWSLEAEKIDLQAVFSNVIDLNYEQYQYLHSGNGDCDGVEFTQDRFVIRDVGKSQGKTFNDKGVEYYAYIKSAG